MNERLNSGCTIQVLKKGSQVVQRWVVAWEAVASLDSGNAWCVVRTDVGPPVLVAVACSPFLQANGGNAPAPGLGKGLPYKGSRVAPTGRLPGFGSNLLVAWSSSLPPLGKEHMAAPTSAPGPSLGPSQVSLLNALDLLSNILGPAEFDRLRKVSDLPPPLQPLEPTNDQLALELACKMQQQEQMKKQVGPLQQRVVDAEVKLLKQQEQLRDTTQTISDLDIGIAELRKNLALSPGLPSNPADG